LISGVGNENNPVENEIAPFQAAVFVADMHEKLLANSLFSDNVNIIGSRVMC
jgi:hypothetical protein